MTRFLRLFLLNVIDISIAVSAYILSALILWYFDVVTLTVGRCFHILATVVLAYCLSSFIFGVNRTIWRYSSVRNYFSVVLSAFTATLVVFLYIYLRMPVKNQWIYFAVIWMFISATTVLSRMVYKEYLRYHNQRNAVAYGTRLLIVGAGSAGYLLLKDIGLSAGSLLPVGFVDDDRNKQNRTIDGVRVMGTVADIPQICERERIQMVYIAIPSASNEQRARILEFCSKVNVAVRILPSLTDCDASSPLLNNIREVTPEELLGREPIQLLNDRVFSLVSAKTIAITGGGGSIGSELCRQIAAHKPKRLVIIDIYENNAYAIQQELREKYGDALSLEVYIASVRDRQKINYLLSLEKPNIVFHAAAHKHVPLMETSPEEAVKNNVMGTLNTMLAADAAGADRFILISTDKAVNPTNVMGATKRICEMLMQYVNQTAKHTVYAAVRFGNVLGSNGSVIPLFREQLKTSGVLTVTHPDVIRYFMTIPEASQLVILAGFMAKGGEIYVLDMGNPVKIDDLAKKMINLSGKTLGVDAFIKYTGLRPGEKLYEELLMKEEGLKKTEHRRIFIGKPICFDQDLFMHRLIELREIAELAIPDTPRLMEKIKDLVPTFSRYIPSERITDAETTEENQEEITAESNPTSRASAKDTATAEKSVAHGV